MTNPIITYPDPRRAVRDSLAALLTGRSEAYAQGAVVSVKGPKTGGPLPHVQVFNDGKFTDANLNGRATVRVVVWHKDEGLGEDLASLAEALLLARGSSALLRGVSPLSGPRPTGDPDTGAPMSYFTITARLRPIQLQEGA